MLKYKWDLDPRDHVWKMGTSENGCGVFYENDEQSWYGNVVVSNNIFPIGPEESKEEMMEECEREFDRIKLELG